MRRKRKYIKAGKGSQRGNEEVQCECREEGVGADRSTGILDDKERKCS